MLRGIRPTKAKRGEVIEINKKIYANDPEIMEIWKKAGVESDISITFTLF